MKFVSMCLACYPCRYDGAAKSDIRVVALVREGGALLAAEGVRVRTEEDPWK